MSFLFKAIIAALLLLGLSACTSKDPNLLVRANGFKFRSQAPVTEGLVATYKGEPIQLKQILSQSFALQEYTNVENELLFVMLYRHLLETQKSEILAGKKILVQVFLADPGEKAAGLLQSQGLALNPALSLQFSQPTLVLPALTDATLAKINDQSILISNLNLNHLRYQIIKHKQQEEILTRLEGLFSRRLLLQAAQVEQKSIEDFIQNKIVTQKIEIDSAEVKAFAKKNNVSEDELSPEMFQKMTAILKDKKKQLAIESYVAKNFLAEPISIFFNPMNAVFQLNPNMVTVWGYDSAPIHVALFSEMLCNQCVELGHDLIQLRKEFEGQLKISLNHFFSDSDRNSRMLAEASMCASGQDPKFFGKFYDAFVSKKLAAEESVIYQTAQEIGADVEALKSCFMQQTHKDLVQSHIDYAKSINVMSIPTLVIEDQVFEGKVDAETIRQELKKQVERKGDPWYRVLYRRFKSWSSKLLMA